MYQNSKPSISDLPTSKQLLRSTIIAFLAAVAILVTVVLPAEYSIDPTGIGRALGLTEMGEIKAQLAEEAAADAAMDAARAKEQTSTDVKTNEAVAVAPTESAPQAASETAWRDEMRVVLKPGEGAEVKLSMKAGEEADYLWTVDGGVVNFDTHGDGGGGSISYEKGRGAPEGKGVIKAAFDGNHGWFWRNREDVEVTVVIRARGQYAEMKRAM